MFKHSMFTKNSKVKIINERILSWIYVISKINWLVLERLRFAGEIPSTIPMSSGTDWFWLKNLH